MSAKESMLKEWETERDEKKHIKSESEIGELIIIF
jgi:hypothetical protein